MSERDYPQEQSPEEFLFEFNDKKLSDLDEYLQTFELSTSRFINAFTSAMDGTAGKHFYDAVTLSHGARVEHVQELQDLSEHLFDMDRDTGVRIWAATVHATLKQISDGMEAINFVAQFTVPTVEELIPKGLEYFEGMEKALDDGAKFYRVGDYEDENDAHVHPAEPIEVQDLPQLVEELFDGLVDDEDIEELNELGPIQDQYGNWVIAEYDNTIGTYLDNLLELCPLDKYPEIQ